MGKYVNVENLKVEDCHRYIEGTIKQYVDNLPSVEYYEVNEDGSKDLDELYKFVNNLKNLILQTFVGKRYVVDIRVNKDESRVEVEFEGQTFFVYNKKNDYFNIMKIIIDEINEKRSLDNE